MGDLYFNNVFSIRKIQFFFFFHCTTATQTIELFNMANLKKAKN